MEASQESDQDAAFELFDSALVLFCPTNEEVRSSRPDWKKWVATPPDPELKDLKTDELIKRLQTADPNTRNGITTELAHRAYGDAAALTAILPQLRNNDAEIRFRMRWCLYVLWRMLRAEAGASADDLKKEADKLDKEKARHDDDASEYGNEASASEAKADDLEKQGDTAGGKAAREEAAHTRERERKARRRAREAGNDRNEAQDDQEEAEEDEKSDDNNNEARKLRKEARKKRHDEREKRKKERAQESKADADADRHS